MNIAESDSDHTSPSIAAPAWRGGAGGGGGGGHCESHRSPSSTPGPKTMTVAP